jgi:hypothetical protein
LKQPVFLINYGYMWGYGRLVLDGLWNESKTESVPSDLKLQSQDLFAVLTGNGLRMSLYLQSEELANQTISADQKAQLVSWLGNSINPSNGALRTGGLKAMHDHFSRYHAATLSQDVVLLETLRTALSIPGGQWP